MDLEVYPPFTIHEGQFALYLADDEGNVGSTVFLGGRLEELEPELEFTKMRLDRHGDPFGRVYHSDEQHKFAIKNLWVMNRALQIMPQVRRNQQYVFVVRWYDNESGVWNLRTYYGVTADGHRLALSDQVYHQNVPFTAQYADEQSGLRDPPELAQVIFGMVRFVSGPENLLLYRYDFTANQFTAISSALLTGRASISQAAPFTITVAGTTALQADATGVRVKELTAIGGSFPLTNPVPRLEFWIGRIRVASLTKSGELATPDLSEVDTEPVIDGPGYRLTSNGVWAAALARGVAYSKSFSETLT